VICFQTMISYGVKAEQIFGAPDVAPDWFNTDLYDRNAKAEKPSTPMNSTPCFRIFSRTGSS
jgi:hypothetical protein